MHILYHGILFTLLIMTGTFQYRCSPVNGTFQLTTFRPPVVSLGEGFMCICCKVIQHSEGLIKAVPSPFIKLYFYRPPLCPITGQGRESCMLTEAGLLFTAQQSRCNSSLNRCCGEQRNKVAMAWNQGPLLTGKIWENAVIGRTNTVDIDPAPSSGDYQAHV